MPDRLLIQKTLAGNLHLYAEISNMVFNSENLKTNIRQILSVIVNIIYEAVGPCLIRVGKMDYVLAGEIDSLREKEFSIFGAYEEPA